MLKNFYAIAVTTNSDLVAIYAEEGKTQTVVCVVTLDTLGDLFGKSAISQTDARRVVSAEMDKFAKVISAKFEEDPHAFTPNPEAPHVLRYDLTLSDLQLGGQTYSASVLDAPPTTWGKDGKF